MTQNTETQSNTFALKPKATNDYTALSDTNLIESLNPTVTELQCDSDTITNLFTTDTHQLITQHTDSTATLREGFVGEELPQTLATNHGIIALIILAFVFFATSYHRSAKYLQHTLKSLFKINMRGNMFDETTINENQLKLSLLAITFITEGIALYHAWIENMVINNNLILPLTLLCIAICFIYYLLQRFTYRVLGNIFSSKQQTQLFDENFNAINQLIGLFLVPFVLLIIFVPNIASVAGSMCFIIYVLSRLIIIYKGIRIFSLQLYNLLYLILYLCALEITPFFLIKRVVVDLNIFLN